MWPNKFSTKSEGREGGKKSIPCTALTEVLFSIRTTARDCSTEDGVESWLMGCAGGSNRGTNWAKFGREPGVVSGGKKHWIKKKQKLRDDLTLN